MTLFNVEMLVCCIALIGASLAPSARADKLNSKTVITFGGKPAAEPKALLALLGLMALIGVFALRVPGKPLQRNVFSNKFLGYVLGAALSLLIAPLSLMAQSVRTPVNLGSAGNYVVLSETGITDVPPSAIVGNIGASPITGAAIHVTCAEVTGTITAVDAAGPAPCSVLDPVNLGTAIGNMGTAYTDAAGRTIPDFTNLGAGNISGLTLVPGLYKWSTGVLVDNTGFTLSGGPNAVWIFQIAGDLTMANSAHVTLAGGARAVNIFWQIGGGAGLTLGTGSVFYGNALTATAVIMNTGSSLIGRALAVTDVTLAMSPVTSPGTLTGGLPSPVPPTVSSTFPANSAPGVPVNSALTATFSEGMNPTTITSLTFTLLNGLTPIAGTVSWVGVTATFTPSLSLPANTMLTATITTGAQDPAGVALATNYVWTFTTGAAPDITPPTVSSTVPASNAANVPIGNALSATFSEALNALTVTTTTFTLKQGNTPVSGTVTYSGVTATFTPTSTLAPNLPFTATITTGVTDLAGNALAANYVWNFTTGAAPDVTPPTVSSTVPASNAANVPIGNALSATFSEALNALTVTTTTFTLKQANTPVSGTVTYSGVTATFTPTSALAPNLPFTATITTGVTDLAGNALAASDVWSFTTGAAPDITPPTVSSTVPASNAANVPIGNALSATFSEALNALTVTTATFTLKQGNTPVSGTVTYSGVTATFTPTSTLAPNLPFATTITTGITDLAGNALAANLVWIFTTGAAPDITPPTVSATAPASNAANVAIGNALSATFSEALNPLTLTTTTFTLKQGNTAVSGTVSYTGVTATFTPTSTLAPNLPFTATITTGVTDLAGNALTANVVWTFTTGAAPDITPPAVISTVPASGVTLVGTTSNLVATFSKSMNPSTISTATFTLQQGNTPVTGTVTYAGASATFRPVNNLAPNTLYSAVITTGAADLAGNALPGNYLWSFTTGAASGPGQTPVCLANFAVLAGSAIGNSGSTQVIGDLGVSPGASVIGFPPGTIKGTIHGGDAAAAQGMADITAAYAEAVSRSAGIVSVAGDIGGQTFTPGIYSSTSSLQISAADLTLDGKGNVNAVFVFRTASTLTTGSGRQVILIGGAQASNVFWQVGTSATLGANSIFNGSILADQAITLNTSATVNGRLAAIIGTITLNSNTIVSPAPAIAAAAIFNAAGWAQTVAAGSIAAVLGNNFGSSLTSAAAFPLPATLGETSVQIGTQGAPLYMTSCSQVNLQIPWELVDQTQAPVSATVGSQVSASQPAILAPFAPGIFTVNQLGSGQGAVEIAPTAVLAAPLGTNSRPVNRGEYIAIFSTGLGPVLNQPATGAAALSSPLSSTTTLPIVTIGGVSAPVTFSGLAPGFAGLYQVNAVVPATAPPGASVNVVISMGGVQSNTVTIAIQ